MTVNTGQRQPVIPLPEGLCPMHQDLRLKHIADLGLPPYHLAVMVALNRHANYQTHECFPSLTTIARESQVSRRHVVNVLQELSKAGHITLRSGKRHRQPTVYTLLPRHLASARNAPETKSTASAPCAHEPTTNYIPPGAYGKPIRKRKTKPDYTQPCGRKHWDWIDCLACRKLGIVPAISELEAKRH